MIKLNPVFVIYQLTKVYSTVNPEIQVKTKVTVVIYVKDKMVV